MQYFIHVKTMEFTWTVLHMPAHVFTPVWLLACRITQKMNLRNEIINITNC